MQTRSQTAAAAIAINTVAFIDNIDNNVSRKTRLIRRTNILPAQNPFVAVGSNIHTASSRILNNQKLLNIRSTIMTRSRKRELDLMKKPKYDVDIDFDGASKAWNKNKTRIGNGCYVYK